MDMENALFQLPGSCGVGFANQSRQSTSEPTVLTVQCGPKRARLNSSTTRLTATWLMFRPWVIATTVACSSRFWMSFRADDDAMVGELWRTENEGPQARRCQHRPDHRHNALELELARPHVRFGGDESRLRVSTSSYQYQSAQAPVESGVTGSATAMHREEMGANSLTRLGPGQSMNFQPSTQIEEFGAFSTAVTRCHRFWPCVSPDVCCTLC